jgi:polar amino acid transport system permease protein
VTWHWEAVPRNFKYFMIGRTPLEALLWWGLLFVATAALFFLSWKAYRHQAMGNGGRRNVYLGILLGIVLALVATRRVVYEGIAFLSLGGFLLTMVLSVIVVVVCFFVGLVFGLMRTSHNPLIRYPAMIYIEIIRGGPLLMVIFWFYFMLPQVFRNLQGLPQAEFFFATVAMIAFYGAAMAEVIRAGILSIPHGQTEAAISTGLTPAQAFLWVVMPQALKNMIPAIVGTFIAVVKDTSLVYLIGVAELTRTVLQVSNRVMNAPMELFTFAAVVYFVPCWLLSVYSRSIERKLTPSR